MVIQRYIAGKTAVKIAQSVEDSVAARKLGSGDSLPTVRALASDLGVAPATVAAAYRILQDRAITSADGRRGTRIRHAPPLALPASIPLPPGVTDLAGGNPALDFLPDLGAAMRRAVPRQRIYGDELNDPSLIGIARLQFEADGVGASHIAVAGGALDGIERVLREHLRPGDRVVVEDPCFTGIADLLASMSLVPVAVAVDDEGMRPPELRERVTGAKAVVFTPRAQNPFGAALTERRARVLRTLLRSHPDLLIIEDDHAGPIAGTAYVTLSGTTSNWAVVRSVSKSLGPDLRLAIISGDERTITRVEGRQTLGIRWVSHVLQRLVAALWKDRSVQRLLVRAENTYSERRNALIEALASHGVPAHGASGLNVWIPMQEETNIVQALLRDGWAVRGGERYRIQTPPAIRVTISALQPAEARRFAAGVAAFLNRPRRSTNA